MAELITKRCRKKAFLRNVAFAVSVAETGDVELTLFAGRREVTRTLKAGEAQLLAHLLTQTWPQLGGHQSRGGFAPSSHRPWSISGIDTNA